MLHSLTSLRFFAAFLVFVHHLNYFKGLGNAGVTFFFVLSGFILTYNYHEKFIDISKEKLLKFYINRFSRIYPVHLLTFFISFIVITRPDIMTHLINFFLLQSYFPNGDIVFSFNPVSWSISTEMFFYILFPFIIWLFINSGFNNNIKLVYLGLITLALIALLIGFFIKTFQPLSFFWWFVYIFPLNRIIDFLVGVFTALIFAKIKKQKENHSWKFTFIEIITILGFVFAILIPKQGYEALGYATIYLPFAALIIFVFAMQKGFLSKILSNKIFVFMGEISYSFYMIHYLVILYFAKYIEYYVTTRDILMELFILSISLSLSIIIYKLYEIPMQKIIRSRFKHDD